MISGFLPARSQNVSDPPSLLPPASRDDFWDFLLRPALFLAGLAIFTIPVLVFACIGLGEEEASQDIDAHG